MAPFTLLLLFFIFDVSTFEYVWLHGGNDLPLAYRISSLWAGREGPLLLWVAMLGALLLIDGKRHSNESVAQHQFRIRLHLGFSIILFLIAMYLNPFRFTPDPNLTRPGLNALLQTNLMVIHPPAVFAFYTLCIGVGLHAITAMLVSGLPARNRILHLARPALFVGTLGVGLGGLWAYTVLDWGGYWAWDPVETGSLLPWLTLILILHFRLPKGMAGDDRWYIGLGALPAFFAVHATLVTRANGVWESIHSFVADQPVDSSMGPVQRTLDIGFTDAAGLEVHVYLIVLALIMWLVVRHFASARVRDWTPLIMLIGSFVGVILESLEVGLLAGIFLFLMWSHRDSRERTIWMASGVMLMLFSSWAFLLPRTHAFIGMLIFLLPWLLDRDSEDVPMNWNDGKWQQRLVLWTPLAIVGPFLLLTWLLLLSEVDGENLASHEMFGLPILCLGALGLTVYAWRKVVPPPQIPWILSGLLLFSVIFAYIWGNSLPGDSDHYFSDYLTRGMVAGFALPLLTVSIPPMVRLIWLRCNSFERRPNPLNLRRISMHVAHLGIILLLLGHVFTTTLVQRGDSSHVVVLPHDTPIEHRGYWYTFTELTSTQPGDDDWESNVGDGLIEVTIEVSGTQNGPILTTLSPGMLRFDEGGIPARSETDTWHRLQGDLIVIFDVNQAQELGIVSWMQTGEDVDSIRLTVYDLTGSHLVWFGWSLLLIGTGLNWIMIPSRGADEEE